MTKHALLVLMAILPLFVFGQDWWTKTKKEAVPTDLTSSLLLVERFKNQKIEDIPIQAFMDKDKRDKHSFVEKTNNNIEKYNVELKEKFKNYKHEYKVVSKKKTEDLEKYPYSAAKYVLKHAVYLRKYKKQGQTKYFYTYLFYFYDREADKSYPYIYIFEEERLKGADKLIGYLNTL